MQSKDGSTNMFVMDLSNRPFFQFFVQQNVSEGCTNNRWKGWEEMTQSLTSWRSRYQFFVQ
jgi:hypothetical protein